jgi:hypothetical protein
MFIRTIAITGLATMLVSAAAFAASSTPASTVPTSVHKASSLKTGQTQQLADRCTSLMSQFDQDITSHATAAKAATAKSLRAKATTECQSNHQSAGVKHLVQALKDIGVKANS